MVVVPVGGGRSLPVPKQVFSIVEANVEMRTKATRTAGKQSYFQKETVILLCIVKNLTI